MVLTAITDTKNVNIFLIQRLLAFPIIRLTMTPEIEFNVILIAALDA